MILKKFIIGSALISILGIIPWEHIFSLDVRNDLWLMMLNGTLALSGLILLLSGLSILIIRQGKWYSALFMLLFPIAIGLLCFVWVISLFGPAKWQDRLVYTNGDKYLIVQDIVYGRDGVETKYRVILTASAHNAIRHIDILQISNLNDQIIVRKPQQFVYQNKLWQKEIIK